jgi:hypothetical protein
VALRAVRGRTALSITAAAVTFGMLAAFAERKVAAGDAASRALQGPVFGLALPIAVLALVSAAMERRRVDDVMNAAGLFGASRRLAALGAAAGLALVAAMLGLMTAAASTLVAYGPPSAVSVTDAVTAGWIGALVAATYAALFMAASTFGARGGGRLVVLVADLLLGPLSSKAAALMPRAHGLNLLGAADVAPGFSQRASFGVLVLLMVLFGLVLARRVRP